MKGRSKNIVLAVFAGLLAIGVWATASFATEETTVVGQVWAQVWDDMDQVTAATITTQDGEEYWIVDNPVGKELFKLDLQTVKVTGSFGVIGEGKKAFTVTKYEIVQSPQ
jgi:hypothetical protein